MEWNKNAVLHNQVQHNRSIKNNSIDLVMLEPNLQTGCKKGLISIINVCPSIMIEP